MLNACKADISRILSPSVSAGSSSVRSSQFHRPSDRSNNLQISTIGHEEPVVSAVAQVIGGESALSGSPVSLSPLEACQDKRLHQAQVHQQPVNSSAQFLDGLSSGALNVLSKNPPQPVVHPSCHVAGDVNQEFKELLLLQDKFIDYPSLDFYSQNLFDYEQGAVLPLRLLRVVSKHIFNSGWTLGLLLGSWTPFVQGTLSLLIHSRQVFAYLIIDRLYFILILSRQLFLICLN